METLPITPLTATSTSREKKSPEEGDGSLFGTLLDMINPLQHIPVVSTMYREATGDTISAGARIIGGGLFGGVLGAASSLFNVAVEAETGKDVCANLLAALPEGKSGAVYAAPQATELAADRGEALLTIALTGASEPAASPTQYLSLQPTPANLTQYSDPSLGLADSNKALQFKAGMYETLTGLVN